ncbi:hypothetical protein L3X38_027123 [Prunus dulcis]|uniref:Uncharacterized protein n=1 Tax=Prunus dulcis TaxID=3755 RepID=A0AAD4YZ56_PRUDU|nr:hypothetical protein L3X38_027123 [Prunus dulcis]
MDALICFLTRLVTVNDSLLLDNGVAVGVARGLVTPKDVRMLGTMDDNRVVSDAMSLSVQSATSVTSVEHRLICPKSPIGCRAEFG